MAWEAIGTRTLAETTSVVLIVLTVACSQGEDVLPVASWACGERDAI